MTTIIAFFKDNYQWICAIIAAVISAIAGISKISTNKRKQSIKNITNSNVTAVNGSINIDSSNNKNKK